MALSLRTELSRLVIPRDRVYVPGKPVTKALADIDRWRGAVVSYLDTLRDLLSRTGVAGPQGEQGPTGDAGQDGSDATVRAAEIALSATQTTNLTVGDHVEWDEIGGSLSGDGVALSTGVGQADGTVTLAGGGVYKVETLLRGQVPTSNGGGGFRWRTGGADFNTVAGVPPGDLSIVGNTRTLDFPSSPTGVFVVAPASDLAITLDILSLGPGAVTDIRADSRVVITEVA